MLSLTTSRHHLFVTIGGIYGSSSDDFESYSENIDNLVDVVYAACQEDENIVEDLAACNNRAEAYSVIATHMDKDIIKQKIASDICRRVLYLLCPDRFGFEKFGWIH